MSTNEPEPRPNPPGPSTSPAAVAAADHVSHGLSSENAELKIISHSGLFYWWPVWAIGFILSILTYIDGHLMALVPPGTQVYSGAEVKTADGKMVKGDALVFPETAKLPQNNDGTAQEPILHMAVRKDYGVLFTIVLMLVILITNVPMRGMWSVVVIVVVVSLSVIFAAMGWWDNILSAFHKLQIYINAGGYLTIAMFLFVIWLVTILFFDPQIYMVFTPGQMRVCQEIGGGEKLMDTTMISVQKQRNDLFRHWVLGLGSGDLIVRTSGSSAEHFDMPNVLFIGSKLRMIEDMIREKPVVRG